jgi:hypothetical protein
MNIYMAEEKGGGGDYCFQNVNHRHPQHLFNCAKLTLGESQLALALFPFSSPFLQFVRTYPPTKPIIIHQQLLMLRMSKNL